MTTIDLKNGLLKQDNKETLYFNGVSWVSMHDYINDILTNNVNDIFLRLQSIHDIEIGDVDPLTELKLDETIKSLSDIISAVLVSQGAK